MSRSQKIPKRFWWTKRIFACWLLLVTALVASRYWWDHLAQQRLSAEIAAIQARGERVDWVNMAPPPLPDEQNAALYYQRAAASLPTSIDGWVRLDDLGRLPSYRLKHAAEVEAFLSASTGAFEQCRLARDLPGVNWGFRHTSPGVKAVPHSLGPIRTIAKLLRLRAAWQAEHGDSAGAIETLRDIEALGRAVAKDTGLIGSLVSIAIFAINTAAIEDVAPRLAIAASPTATQPTNSQAIRALIAELLADHPQTALREGMVLERAATTDTLEWFIGGGDILSCMWWRPSGGLQQFLDSKTWRSLGYVAMGQKSRWGLTPMYRDEQTSLLMAYSQLVAMAEQPTVAKAEQIGQLVDDSCARLGKNDIRSMTRPLSTDLLTALTRAAVLAHGCVAQRRMAAVALALRLFELEKGHPTNSLEQLAPEYLPAVPQDPFDPAGGAIRALLADAKPRLYSLGENRRDDGGSSYGRADIVLFLHPGDRPEEEPYSERANLATQPAPELTTEPATAPNSGD